MKKITLSVMAIAMAIAIVTSTAFALFSSTATVSGVTFSTGNATLQVWDYSGSPASYQGTWPSTVNFANLYPSDTDFQTQDMWLKNESTSAISLNVKLQLTSATTWDSPARDQLFLTVVDTSTGAEVPHSLSDWNTTAYIISASPMAQGEERKFILKANLASTADSTSSNQSVSGVLFTLTGTQE